MSTAIVTGASAGIGTVFARRLAERGSDLVLVARRQERIEGLAEELAAAHGVRAEPLVADLGDPAGVARVAERAAADDVGTLVNNAGINGYAPFAEVDPDIVAKVIAVNVTALALLSRAALPGMLERGEGYLCSTASAAGLLAQLGALGYTVTKHGAVAIAEWLSMTYGDRGIRVSCLCPQYVRTPMVTEGELPVDKLEQVATILEPEQVADAVVEAIREERLLVLPHPEVGTYMAHRGDDHERWLRGMRRLQAYLGV